MGHALAGHLADPRPREVGSSWNIFSERLSIIKVESLGRGGIWISSPYLLVMRLHLYISCNLFSFKILIPVSFTNALFLIYKAMTRITLSIFTLYMPRLQLIGDRSSRTFSSKQVSFRSSIILNPLSRASSISSHPPHKPSPIHCEQPGQLPCFAPQGIMHNSKSILL